MTKSQLIEEIHKKRNSNFTKQQVASIIDDIFDLIKDSLAHGERVETLATLVFVKETPKNHEIPKQESL